ncbi:hypothetical protein JZ751_021420 [Albula glossodonta]|uniref:Uncharacterized protein n=1 Tax=Albula glossodonta TaxID=121402 RepID=A0A8T2MTH0_9TELE|nr:hypothetical protein JZ751_021420 [Albula glossodonta]
MEAGCEPSAHCTTTRLRGGQGIAGIASACEIQHLSPNTPPASAQELEGAHGEGSIWGDRREGSLGVPAIQQLKTAMRGAESQVHRAAGLNTIQSLATVNTHCVCVGEWERCGAGLGWAGLRPYLTPAMSADWLTFDPAHCDASCSRSPVTACRVSAHKRVVRETAPTALGQDGRNIPQEHDHFTSKQHRDRSGPSKADPSTVTGPSKAEPSTVTGPSTADPSTVTGPSTADPSTVTGPSKADPSTVTGPSTADPSTVTGSSTADPSTVTVSSKADPSTVTGPITVDPSTVTEPSTADPSTVTGPSTADPSTVTGPSKADPSTADPSTVTEPNTADPSTVTQPSKADPSTITEPGTADPSTVTEPSTADPSTVTGPSRADPSTVTGPSRADPSTVTQPRKGRASLQDSITESSSTVAQTRGQWSRASKRGPSVTQPNPHITLGTIGHMGL